MWSRTRQLPTQEDNMLQIRCNPLAFPPNQRRDTTARLNRRFIPALAGVLLAVLGCADEQPTAPTMPKQISALATTSAALAFIQVSGGNQHTCGVTADNRAYCWGYNFYGQLGDGTNIQRLKPVAVSGTLRFRQVSAGYWHTCGVTPSNQAYCWGENSAGTLGDGSKTNRSTPTLVAGGHLFRRLDAGSFFTCGVSYPDNKAYCWGYNDRGNLGDGTATRHSTPVAVSGNLQFRDVEAGLDATCGVTTSSVAYCWGSDSVGQLGDGRPAPYSLTPTPVATSSKFSQIDAGSAFACGVTPAKRAFCWGSGRQGQIGDGKNFLRYTPRPAGGGILFDRVTTGGRHTCGENTENHTFCWGTGGIGDGTNGPRLTPVEVAGGHFFNQVSAGGEHTCGKTGAGVAYCWGNNEFGQLGDGTQTDRVRPVAVVGP
jgi:alpha-tubulin suppressor-like RCC1 family protein